MKIQHIKWIDASSIDEWTDIKELDGEPEYCESIGWIVKETKDTIQLAGTIGQVDDCCCIICIPKCCVRSRRTIK